MLTGVAGFMYMMYEADKWSRKVLVKRGDSGVSSWEIAIILHDI